MVTNHKYYNLNTYMFNRRVKKMKLNGDFSHSVAAIS